MLQPPPDLPSIIQIALDGLLEAARGGQLSASEASRLIAGEAVGKLPAAAEAALQHNPKQLGFMMRFIFTRSVSWALLTSEWMDTTAALICGMLSEAADSRASSGGSTAGPPASGHALSPRAPRVVEVCAGINLLAGPMAARGLDWVATDRRSRPDAVAPVQELEALAAVQAPRPKAQRHTDV